MAATTIYLITGANRGLGLGLVKALLARPSTTVIASVRNDEAEDSIKAENIPLAAGSKLLVFQLDFSSAIPPSNISEAFNTAVGAGAVDHIDVLINNAGTCPPMTFAADTPIEDLRAAFETNSIAPLMVFQAFWPLLQKSPTSSPKLIMITSSVGGITMQEPFPGGAYGASRAAQNWITRALHLQNEAKGLVAVALHPGWVKTRAGDFVAQQWNHAAGPPTTVKESVKGMLEVIDAATRENYSGKFVTETGMIMPW